MELLEKFGIDWRTILAQIINFTVVLLVLWKFAYKPILKALHDRSEKIAKSLKDAETIDEKMKNVAKQEEEMLKKAEEKTQDILASAHEKAKEDSAILMSKTKDEVRTVIDKARRDIQKAKDGLIEEVRGDIGVLVAEAVAKVLEEKVHAKENERLIEKALEKVFSEHNQ